MKILVLGGAGYIGSHFSAMVSEQGHSLTVFDNLSTGHEWAVDRDHLVVGDILDEAALGAAMRGCDAVCHFAAKSIVSESVQYPELYRQNNVDGTRSILRVMSEIGVRKLIFSSTAAVYGIPTTQESILYEHDQTNPINPYGHSKLEAEKLIAKWVREGRGNALVFRYFNAAGADYERGLGEAHEPETHLIPNILKTLICEHQGKFRLYGDDYDTPDGTCVRDYVHVNDIARAHSLALDHYEDRQSEMEICNLGTSTGVSNRRIIDFCEQVTGRALSYDIQPRRLGDPPRLVASNTRAKSLLGWEPNNSDIKKIIESAYLWHLGYERGLK